jgi:hypothetical protein
MTASQASEAGYFTLPWNGSVESSNWESNPAPAWGSEAAVADVTTLTAQTSLTPSGGALFVQDDHLRPNVRPLLVTRGPLLILTIGV